MVTLALSGWRGSGKDTAAEYLVKEHGFIRVSFADALKELVAQQYDIPLEYMHEPSKKELPLHQYPVIPGDPFGLTIHDLLTSELSSGYWTPRALCILEGSTKRSVYSNYWVRTVVQQIMQDPTRNYVISDMRYQTEADTLKLLLPNIITGRVVRWCTVDTQDPSERNLDSYEFDLYITNTSNLAALHNQLDDLVDTHVPRPIS